MALKSNTILSITALLLLLFISHTLFYAITFVLGTSVGHTFFLRDDAIALIYGVGPKKLPIVLAISMNAFDQRGADIALIVALAYVIQPQTSAWCDKFVDKCFDSRQEVEALALASEEA